MSFYATPQIKLLFQKMEHTQARLETTSDNVARSGVPGQREKTVEDFKSALRKGGKKSRSIKTTQSGHMTGSVKETKFSIKSSKKQGQPSLTGNSISQEEQLLKLNEATVDFHRLRQINQNSLARIRMIATLGTGK